MLVPFFCTLAKPHAPLTEELGGLEQLDEALDVLAVGVGLELQVGHLNLLHRFGDPAAKRGKRRGRDPLEGFDEGQLLGQAVLDRVQERIESLQLLPIQHRALACFTLRMLTVSATFSTLKRTR